jgi:hypothetical protein
MKSLIFLASALLTGSMAFGQQEGRQDTPGTPSLACLQQFCENSFSGARFSGKVACVSGAHAMINAWESLSGATLPTEEGWFEAMDSEVQNLCEERFRWRSRQEACQRGGHQVIAFMEGRTPSCISFISRADMLRAREQNTGFWIQRTAPTHRSSQSASQPVAP